MTTGDARVFTTDSGIPVKPLYGPADAARCAEFRTELAALQGQLRNYTHALAAMADVEDLTTLETAG